MVNLTILFDTTMRIRLSDKQRHDLNEQLHRFNFHVENLEGGYNGARKMIHDRIHTVLTKMHAYFSESDVRIHIAPENRNRLYYSFSYRGDRFDDFKRISRSAWDHCVQTSTDPTVVACVELVPHSDTRLAMSHY